jgi:spectinomycin phosphotransferase
MLDQPSIPDAAILTCLQDIFGLDVVELAFLPLGYDPHTAVYRAATTHGTRYFAKLRSGVFHEPSVTLPSFLHDQGIAPIIPPLPTTTSTLWAELPPYKLILYPFVEGPDAYEADLTDEQWVQYGAALRRIHTAPILPPEIRAAIRQEDYSPQWRDAVRRALDLTAADIVDDPSARDTLALLRAERATILDLVARAERLAAALQADRPPFVVCHSDLHADNFLLTESGAFYLVDWDGPIRAPKERDLMVPGAGLMGKWRPPQEEEALFYQGYGPTDLDHRALAYYRAERIIADIAVYCDELLLSTAGGDDRAQSLHYLRSNFAPGGTIELAVQTSDFSKRHPKSDVSHSNQT